MGRWQPDARGRLGQAAMELFSERGFEQTTVTEIAARTGLTERTFFRHFADKREVLFTGGEVLQEALVTAVLAADPATAPMEVVASAFETTAESFFGDTREHSLQRQVIIDAHPELQERELIKMARLSSAVADALRQRGVPDPAAMITADAGVVIFRAGFERWLADGETRSCSDLIRASLQDLRAATSAGE